MLEKVLIDLHHHVEIFFMVIFIAIFTLYAGDKPGKGLFHNLRVTVDQK